MSDVQKNGFLGGEGDQWFARNASKLKSDRPELAIFGKYIKPGQSVLEIGCSGGSLAPFFAGMGARYSGLDPSRKAIDEASSKYPDSRFHLGTSEALPFQDGSFDFVFFGFCLYMVDRSLLARSIAEADRVLKGTGYLAILDFETTFPCQRPYAHVKGMSSYKMDYARLFLAFPHYASCFKSVFSHTNSDPFIFEEQLQERVSVQVLHKNIAGGYSPG